MLWNACCWTFQRNSVKRLRILNKLVTDGEKNGKTNIVLQPNLIRQQHFDQMTWAWNHFSAESLINYISYVCLKITNHFTGNENSNFHFFVVAQLSWFSWHGYLIHFIILPNAKKTELHLAPLTSKRSKSESNVHEEWTLEKLERAKTHNTMKWFHEMPIKSELKKRFSPSVALSQ